ncbi:hypothetical protein D3C86_1396790 [compost metagenome]
MTVTPSASICRPCPATAGCSACAACCSALPWGMGSRWLASCPVPIMVQVSRAPWPAYCPVPTTWGVSRAPWPAYCPTPRSRVSRGWRWASSPGLSTPWPNSCPGCNRRSRWQSGTPACWRCWSASIWPTKMKSVSCSLFAASWPTGRPSSGRPASISPSPPTCCRIISAACWGSPAPASASSPVRSTSAP